MSFGCCILSHGGEGFLRHRPITKHSAENCSWGHMGLADAVMMRSGCPGLPPLLIQRIPSVEHRVRRKNDWSRRARDELHDSPVGPGVDAPGSSASTPALLPQAAMWLPWMHARHWWIRRVHSGLHCARVSAGARWGVGRSLPGRGVARLWQVSSVARGQPRGNSRSNRLRRSGSPAALSRLQVRLSQSDRTQWTPNPTAAQIQWDVAHRACRQWHVLRRDASFHCLMQAYRSPSQILEQHHARCRPGLGFPLPLVPRPVPSASHWIVRARSPASFPFRSSPFFFLWVSSTFFCPGFFLSMPFPPIHLFLRFLLSSSF